MTKENPLGYVEINKLIRKFALPSIVGMLVNSIYNIVDQLFIGQAVGELGNAATNIAFPLTLIVLSISLLFGIGGAANFNLALGENKKEDAPYYVGNSFFITLICGIILMVISLVFLEPLMILFGSPDNVLEYAKTYVGIIAIGFPFVVMVICGGHLIRADGSPARAMIFSLSGAIINIFLDYLLTIAFKFGIAGAAAATVISQIISAILILGYMKNYKTVKLKRCHFILKKRILFRTMRLGIASFVNQISMMIVQVVSNNLLKTYGAMSIYGASVPIACAGIVMKINQLVFSIVIGIAQGCQPIFSYNYGAQKYDRVKKTYLMSLLLGVIVSAASFALIQLFPGQIFGAFGNGSKEYLEYGVIYLKTFMMFVIFGTMQPVTNTFFSAIGKAGKSMMIALVKQIFILLPAMLILTPIVGVNGVMYAGPISDIVSGILVIIMVVFEFRNINRLERALAVSNNK